MTSEDNSNQSFENQTEENEPKGAQEKWGFDLYPERRNDYQPSWKSIIFKGEGRGAADKMKCQKRIWKVINKSPLLKLMLGALESSGCPVDLARHIACETCDQSVLGGYDMERNQVVVCYNVSNTDGRVQGALAHEFVHMFDFCNNKLDFQNLDHLACTEIKAANLTSCSFFTAVSLKPSSVFSIAEAQKECVKTKAVWSIKYARNVSEAEAKEAVDRVFPKCYNDLEPLGRIPRRNSRDFFKAYRERHIYGYT